jgi:hypothetical protein
LPRAEARCCPDGPPVPRRSVEETFGHRFRFVSAPLALASETGRFPGWRPRSDPCGFPKAPARFEPL